MKLAAAALSLVLIVPGLAQSQAPDPPYLLDPGESPPATQPSGSYPPLTTNWGYRHPECPSAATIESTSCGSTTIAAGSTVQNCTMNGGVTFSGSNITMNCVKWNAPSSGHSGVYCGTDSCQNIRILRTTMTGNQTPTGPPSNATVFLNLSTSYGGSGPHSMLVDKSIIKANRVGIILGGGKFDKDLVAIEPGYAFVIRNSIMREPQYYPGTGSIKGDHSELIALVETVDGVLIENNLLYCEDGDTCNTGNMLAKPSNGASIRNISMIGNRIVSDSTGYALTFDIQSSTATTCVEPVQFRNNVIDLPTGASGVWNYGECPAIQNRTGSSCTGNTLNGRSAGC